MVRVESDKGKVQVSIADTGEGIAPKDLSQLLSDIHSPVIHRGGHPDSSGLGLAIVKQVLALHGVRLQARSTMGRGTTFSFTLAGKRHPRAGDASDGNLINARFSRDI